MRSAPEIGIEFRGYFNNFLRTLERKLDRTSDESYEVQKQEIKILESVEGKTLTEWLEAWTKYLDKKWHFVCLWIINQGYVGAIALIMDKDYAELLQEIVTKSKSI